MRVAILGAGYVGLVTGACFAEFGFQITCVDTDERKIAALAKGEVPIFEPGLKALVQLGLQYERLHFTTDAGEAIRAADVIFIAVGTPSRRGNGEADVSFVIAAAEMIAAHAVGYKVVVTKSTVPVGTTRRVERVLRRLRPDCKFDVAANPEFLREGSAIEDFMRPNRVVIGVEGERARQMLQQLYRPLHLIETPIIFADLETAELIKYASNAFLAMKITFINQMADLCEKVGGDVHVLAKAMGLDHRIGPKFLHPGPGYGGSCFPKDTMALATFARECGAPVDLVETVIRVNEARKRSMVDRILDALGTPSSGKKLAVLGLTFKPNTDDMRESPALTILPRLLERGIKLQCFDPAGMAEAAKLIPGIDCCRDPYEAAAKADGLVLLTEWNLFRALDLDRIKATLHAPLIIDFRNIYDPDKMRGMGFSYHSLGRP
ncbi:UDP-glucose dehydrogenase family protein [Dongia soli]|uniref:UDP-glucose 6-dehydrogenase n=1 Tax=Dongia soli TaxID=600628 RepID=A0ABU5EK37_9PROT|nr:UDP-glucose/GDP-mannose dehydrogenase family protein [Dongia soli]MDY0885650.1 UDP-glucose/GDP-mannose dehydrogenase family protein [Dongia soli]